MRTVVDTILPTTMVGSYPRPKWFRDQLLGRDIRVAFKSVDHAEAFNDATRLAIRDQEEAGLDIVTDGQMYFDDYVGVIGSFCWYMYERIPGFDPAKEEHPNAVGATDRTKEIELLSDWGGVNNSGPVGPGPLRLVDLYKAAAAHATRPLKVSVGAGPVNLAWHVCYGNAWGNRLAGLFQKGYEAVLPFLYDVPIDQFVLDFANRDMVDIGSIRDLPADKEVAIGVVDVRTSMIETPQQIAERIRKVIAVVPPERVYLTTDCGMKPLARPVARMKLDALAQAAQMVRQELGVRQLVVAG